MRRANSAKNKRRNNSSNLSINRGTTMLKRLLTKHTPKHTLNVISCERTSSELKGYIELYNSGSDWNKGKSEPLLYSSIHHKKP